MFVEFKLLGTVHILVRKGRYFSTCSQFSEFLRREVPQGGLVIDYQPSLDGSEEFKLLGTVEGAVSWNPRQASCIFQYV